MNLFFCISQDENFIGYVNKLVFRKVNDEENVLFCIYDNDTNYLLFSTYNDIEYKNKKFFIFNQILNYKKRNETLTLDFRKFEK